MVYDGTKSGLNAALFAPWFALPTVDSMLRSEGPTTWSADNDFGEMFLNFWLHPELRKYAGIDLTGLFPEEVNRKSSARNKRKVLWETWNRCAMGLSPSPYQATQLAHRVKFLAMGNREDPTNVFRWDRILLNLPRDDRYDPTQPWVSKVRVDGVLAADVYPYVDDMQETGPTDKDAWQAASKIAKAAAYYGLQDAARKRRPPSRTPGALAGALIISSETGVYKLVSQERWDKVKEHLVTLGLYAKLETIPRKELECIRGFLVYLSLTYGMITPYLKGIHLTLESWRSDRDSEGWKMTPQEWAQIAHRRDTDVEGGHTEYHDNYLDAPSQVTPAPRFAGDVAALEKLTESIHPPPPPTVLVQPVGKAKAALMFGDALGTGFGSSLWLQGVPTLDTEHGLWTRMYGKRSSNFCEMFYLVARIQQHVEEKTLPPGTELFVFTDNSTAESAFFKGTSKSKLLFNLVLQLKCLEMTGSLFVHVIWVAGTRMIAQGTDGLSRGDLMQGVLTGADMLQYVPLNKTPEERQPGLQIFFIEAASKSFHSKCSNQKHGSRRLLHLETMCGALLQPPLTSLLTNFVRAVHLRPKSAHILIAPALMTSRWRKRLGRVADVVFTVPVGTALWCKDQHEPLIVAFVLPLFQLQTLAV
ncbi:hypothetical protein ACA910_007367 [Epithemia clementina (nom. ined.)]